jgi:hypothetical protein
VAEAFFGQSPSTYTSHKFVVTVGLPLICTSSAKFTEQCIWIVEVIVLVLHNCIPYSLSPLPKNAVFAPKKSVIGPKLDLFSATFLILSTI